MKSILESRYKKLFYFINEDKIAISYCPWRRSFSIGAQEGRFSQEIEFCPWTGSKLPKSLSEEFSRMLEEKDLSIFEMENWPLSWKSEKWWIELGI